jgi:hypothetical protein
MTVPTEEAVMTFQMVPVETRLLSWIMGAVESDTAGQESWMRSEK